MTDKILNDAEVYALVYGKLVNKVLPAFGEAVDELKEKNYPNVGDFIINSIAGMTSSVLKDSIDLTAIKTGMAKPKARKKVLKQLNTTTDLFIRRLNDIDVKGK